MCRTIHCVPTKPIFYPDTWQYHKIGGAIEISPKVGLYQHTENK